MIHFWISTKQKEIAKIKTTKIKNTQAKKIYKDSSNDNILVYLKYDGQFTDPNEKFKIQNLLNCIAHHKNL